MKLLNALQDLVMLLLMVNKTQKTHYLHNILVTDFLDGL